jgi:hypothetical protein
VRAKIGLLHLRVLCERSRGAGQYAPADLQPRGKIGELKSFHTIFSYAKLATVTASFLVLIKHVKLRCRAPRPRARKYALLQFGTVFCPVSVERTLEVLLIFKHLPKSARFVASYNAQNLK